MNSTPYLSHFWSLAVEEQFYILWPLLIYFTKNLRKMKKIIIALILLALSARIYIWSQYPLDLVKYYCNTLTRMDSILMGCFLSIHIKEGKEIGNKILGMIVAFCLIFFAIG